MVNSERQLKVLVCLYTICNYDIVQKDIVWTSGYSIDHLQTL